MSAVIRKVKKGSEGWEGTQRFKLYCEGRGGEYERLIPDKTLHGGDPEVLAIVPRTPAKTKSPKKPTKGPSPQKSPMKSLGTKKTGLWSNDWMDRIKDPFARPPP